MDRADSDNPAERRALRRTLRGVGRLLRWSGLALALIGAAGLVTGAPDAWWLAPSWASLAIGGALMLAGIVRRERNPRLPGG